MADIQFDEEQYNPAYRAEKKSFLVRLVLATGIVSTDEAVQYVLLGIAFFCFIITGIVLFIGNRTSGLSSADVQRIIQLQQTI